MGVKKSRVWTSAVSELSKYTPASSAVAEPTRRFESLVCGRSRKTCESDSGSSLDAQPPQATREVSLIGSDMLVLLNIY